MIVIGGYNVIHFDEHRGTMKRFLLLVMMSAQADFNQTNNFTVINHVNDTPPSPAIGLSFINTTKLITATAVAYYGYTFYKLRRFATYINQKERWSKWKANATLEQLELTKSEDLKLALKEEIQKRYKRDIDYILTKEEKIIHDIDIEINEIKSYINIINIITKCRITIIFPVDKNLYNTCKKKIARLALIKSLLLEN